MARLRLGFVTPLYGDTAPIRGKNPAAMPRYSTGAVLHFFQFSRTLLSEAASPNPRCSQAAHATLDLAGLRRGLARSIATLTRFETDYLLPRMRRVLKRLLLDAVLHLKCGRNDSLCVPETRAPAHQ